MEKCPHDNSCRELFEDKEQWCTVCLELRSETSDRRKRHIWGNNSKRTASQVARRRGPKDRRK